MADLASQIATARSHGFSDKQIADHLAADPSLGPKIAAARQHGYADGDILGHLGGTPASAPATAGSTVRQGERGVADTLVNMADTAYRAFNPGEGLLAQASDATDRVAALIQAATGLGSGPAPAPQPRTDPVTAAVRMATPAQTTQSRQIAASPVGQWMAEQPRNAPERYARTVGQFVPGLAFGPEGDAGIVPQVAVRAANAFAPAVTSETAGYAARQAGATPEQETLVRNATAMATGLGVSAVARGRPPATATPPATRVAVSPQAALRNEGVFLTPGQRIGGLALAAEDKAMSAPILGPAVRSARIRGRESLNRVVANRSLAPIGETVPPDIQPGHDMVAYTEKRLGDAYTHANGLIQNVTPDAAWESGLASARASLRGQPPSVIAKFNSLVHDRVLARMEAGPLDGTAVADIKSQIGELAADNLSGGGADRTLGRALERIGNEVEALAQRTNPNYLAAKKAADTGWANFVRYRRAAASTGTDSGVFTPSQLRASARAEDNTVGKGATAKGQALMGDLADNAASVMNQTIPDSGTAGRYAAGALAATVLTKPAVGIPVAAGLGVAAVPYLLMGRRLATAALRPNASPEVVSAAATRLATLAEKEPKLAPLAAQVSRRARLLGPTAMVAAASPANASQRSTPSK